MYCEYGSASGGESSDAVEWAACSGCGRCGCGGFGAGWGTGYGLKAAYAVV